MFGLQDRYSPVKKYQYTDDCEPAWIHAHYWNSLKWHGELEQPEKNVHTGSGSMQKEGGGTHGYLVHRYVPRWRPPFSGLSARSYGYRFNPTPVLMIPNYTVSFPRIVPSRSVTKAPVLKPLIFTKPSLTCIAFLWSSFRWNIISLLRAPGTCTTRTDCAVDR